MAVRLTGIHTIVFDLDDTLCAERDYAFSGFQAVAEWLKSHWECPFDAAERMRQLFQTGNRRTIFNQVLRETHCPSEEALVPAMVDHYRNHLPDIELLPDAERALHRWSAGYFLGLISDGPLVMQQRKVDTLRLSDRLDRVVLTDAWGKEYWKPHPRAYELMEAESGRNGPSCVYIADNPGKDFIAPNARGWRTVRIDRPDSIYGEIPPAPGGCAEFEVQSLDEVDITC